MIFVTVGTDKGFGFKRLVQACDEAAGEIGVPMVIQAAVTDYEPRHAKLVSYVSIPEYVNYFQQADLIVSHCSIGPVVNAARLGKPLIVFPRRGQYGELADEHQMDFARTLEKKGAPQIKVVYEAFDLKPAIQTFLDSRPDIHYNHAGLNALVSRIKTFIEETENKKAASL